ncbi:hypothetical protein [Sphingomonas morindae]|uniref:Uncharacterized protein n=1 Tax=Sphingomonas morindae TaxID=1541170 RepID=A0ABY4X7I2_9SPHN|nr:hypothetical protein [Sphingomonas morindae]USI72590.1 hypothetical protein LHA26_15080 [Sphingomonas morindae]
MLNHHQAIRAAMAELAAALDRASPDFGLLAPARLRLSRASAERSRFLEKLALPRLRAEGDPAIAPQLDRLTEDFARRRLASSDHVATWTTRAIEADWPGYRAASQRIRAMMEERIQLEARILYPPLRDLPAL